MPPIKKWQSTPLSKLRIVQSKLLWNLFAVKGSAKLAEVSPQPESGGNGYSIGKCIVLDVKEGCLEGRSKEITTLAANMIVEELIESTLESILEEMPDRSTPESQATESPS